ncbi:hypothetical protein AB9P05_03905 [Roseivirga sp. BDSF3-8]|uniref:hypothetical protein n=1 Tax=Roseivirga sp. BDSF3-8 TaxID=3241598 RepID=UPI00353205ED
MDLGPVIVTRKNGEEPFTNGSGPAIQLIDFWKWSVSDLLSNATRGKLAEFIVANALQICSSVRVEWDNYDMVDHDKIRIEVKSSAYLQSWHQNNLSAISFDIAEKRSYCYETNKLGDSVCRNNDFYIFCLLHHKDKSTVDPMDLAQWTFYILPTSVLNEKLGTQRRLSLKRLKSLHPVICSYQTLRTELDRLKSDVFS